MKAIPAPFKITFLLSAVLLPAAGLILMIFGAASPMQTSFDDVIKDNSKSMMAEGRQTFRAS